MTVSTRISRVPVIRRRVLIFLMTLAGLYAWLRWFERRSVYQPTRLLEAIGTETGFPREDVWLTTADGVRLHAWYFPGRHDINGFGFLLCHGNGGNISHRLDQYDALLRLGVAVLAFDYRGFGQSAGTPSEEGTYRDSEAAYDWLKTRGFPSKRIVAHGESLGGGVVVELARRRQVGGFILQSTFTSVTDLGTELFPWLPVRTLGTIRYDTLRKLPGINTPLLVVHSRGDSIIPFAHAERNYRAADEPKFLRELQGDHNDAMEVDREAFSRAVAEFMGVVAGRPSELQ